MSSLEFLARGHRGVCAARTTVRDIIPRNIAS
jgi:hypothetical protein